MQNRKWKFASNPKPLNFIPHSNPLICFCSKFKFCKPHPPPTALAGSWLRPQIWRLAWHQQSVSLIWTGMTGTNMQYHAELAGSSSTHNGITHWLWGGKDILFKYTCMLAKMQYFMQLFWEDANIVGEITTRSRKVGTLLHHVMNSPAAGLGGEITKNIFQPHF